MLKMLFHMPPHILLRYKYKQRNNYRFIICSKESIDFLISVLRVALK